MPARISAVEERVTGLESAVTIGFNEIKQLIRQEISDLKGEQLRDIKASIDRVETDLKHENTRLADDQRRLWDAVRALENGRNADVGTSTANYTWVSGIGHLISGAIGALVSWFVTSGKPPGH